MKEELANIILEEADQEYTIPTYLEGNVKRGIARALKRIIQDKELLADLIMEQQEGA